MAVANSITVTASSLITAAMQEIGVLSPGEQPSNDDAAWVLQKLQRLIDTYNAKDQLVYSVDFTVFTLPVGVSPVTIGPDGNFDINQRPVDIVSASLILNNGAASPNDVEVPMNMRDDAWWAQQTIKGLTSTLPTDLYYSPNWPLGNLYFWPVPQAVNQVRLEMRLIITQITSFLQSFSMPPAYWDLIIYPLAVSLCPSFQVSASPELIRLAMTAVKAVEGNNIQSPRMFSDAPSCPGGRRSRPDFSFLSGLTQ